MKTYNISDAEWQVMQVVWLRKSATAAEVIENLVPKTKWSHRTIRTLLARLVEKEVLSTESQGNRYLYRPLVGRSKCIRQAGKSFVDRVFGGNVGELLVHFVNTEKIDPEQLEQIKQLLEEKQTPKK